MAKKKTPPPAKKPAAKTPEAPKAAPKVHERKARPAEEDRIEKAKRLAADYLTRRDGMDGEMARAVVDSMGAEDVAALNTEAATAVLDKTKAIAASKAAPATTSTIPEEDQSAYIPFVQFTALAADEEFPQLVLAVAELARTKNDAEAEYKAQKKVLIAKMKAAGAEKAECLGIKLAVYQGHNKQINEQLLLERGVSPDVIKVCWKDTPYDDVRVMAPKSPKEG